MQMMISNKDIRANDPSPTVKLAAACWLRMPATPQKGQVDFRLLMPKRSWVI